MRPQDPVHPNCQLACGSYFSDDEVLLMTTVGVLLAEVRIEPHRDISCLYQEKSHDPAALLRDAAHLLLATRRVFSRDQAQITGDLLAPWKPADITDGQHECQSSDRTNAWLTQQELHVRILRSHLLHGIIELLKLSIQNAEQMKQIMPSTICPGIERKGLECRTSDGV